MNKHEDESEKYYKMAQSCLAKNDFFNAAQYMKRAAKMGYRKAEEWVNNYNPDRVIEAENLYKFGMGYGVQSALGRPKIMKAAELGHLKAIELLKQYSEGSVKEAENLYNFGLSYAEKNNPSSTITSKNQKMKCPYCAEDVKNEAIKCKHCGEWFSSRQTENVYKPGTHRFNQSQKKVASAKKPSSAQQQFYEDSIKRIIFPIKIKGLTVNKTDFNYKGKTYILNEIIGILCNYETVRINFVPISSIELSVKIKENVKIRISGRAGLGTKKRVDAIQNSYRYLNHVSYNNRVNYYLNQFKKKGFINYKCGTGHMRIPATIRIYSDGFIEKGSKKINLRKAKEQGILVFGNHWESYAGWNSSLNPREIAISEKKVNLAIRTLRISADWDTNIIHRIIEILSEGKRIS